MSEPIDLQPYTGKWQGTSRLHDPITERPEDSASSVILQSANPAAETDDVPVLQMDYTWAYQGAPQQGNASALRPGGKTTGAVDGYVAYRRRTHAV